ncbi:asparagine synthase-related protein [Desulfonatronospira sp. MSAO_Bac3]|uniref:asparagine synthase-related protein n=1 Tax=Desulfonatronospira sp. MSAO_Bac3 TaxID=2293857 RepID=UPI00257BA9DE|nr:asparagine synthase-related protein [Desulfonatronospira sp. MSAO_Bac3]
MNPTDRLRKHLLFLSPLAIALSGGVDSSTLTFFCLENHIEFTAYTFCGDHLTSFEAEHVQKVVTENSIPHLFIPCQPLKDPKIAANSRERCYYCKNDLYFRLKRCVEPGRTIIDGSNASDLSKYRPGQKALKEQGVMTPFASLGFHRMMVEDLAQELGLNIPRFSRSCLLTRFQYGYQLDSDLVQRLGRAEDYLLRAGLSGFRTRVLLDETVLVQVDASEKVGFLNIEPGFQSLMQELFFYPYRVQYMEFSMISGYFDRS